MERIHTLLNPHSSKYLIPDTRAEGERKYMEKLNLSKLKLASSYLGERIKASGSQIGRTISSKMKEVLQTPAPESKIVDEATAESTAGPNWGLYLRICAMINRGEYDGAEIVRAIKRKLVPGKNPVSQGLSLDLLEACGCEKVFSAVASEEVLEDMVNLIEDSRTEHRIRVRAMQLIRTWGEAEELEYLPVFRQTYMNLKLKETPQAAREEDFPPMLYNLECYLGQQRNHESVENEEDAGLIISSNGIQQPIEDKKEFLEAARNQLVVLSSMLNSDAEPNPLKDELTTSMLEKCKQSLPVLREIIESTSDDEVMLFDALNLHDELQLIISRHLESGQLAEEQW